MTRASQLGWLIRIGNSIGTYALRGDEPMDASRVWLMMDGLAHMVDESPVYRINWVEPWRPVRVSPIVMHFPVTIARGGAYPNFDVRVATTSFDDSEGSTDYTIRASIITPGTNLSVRGLTSGVLGTATVTNPSSSGWNIDTTFTNIDASRCPFVVEPAPTYPGEDPTGAVTRLALVIEFSALSDGDSYYEGSGGAGIIGAQVREYPA